MIPRCATAVLGVLVASVSLAGVNRWTTDGPWGGHVATLVADPRTPGVFYAGTDEGVFKSTNGGRVWAVASTGLPVDPNHNIVVRALALDSLGIIYAGLDPRTDLVHTVYRSSDGGGTWQALGALELGVSPVTILRFGPSNGAHLYAGTPVGFYRSLDSGASWTRSEQIGSVLSLAVDPDNPAILLAGTNIDGQNLWRSSDSGATWTSVFPGLFYTINSLAFDLSDARVVYAGTSFGFYKSTDGGDAWRLIPKGGAKVFVDPVDPSTIYSNGGVSTDRGEHWSRFGPFPVSSESGIETLVVDPSDLPTLFVGLSSGVLRSDDRGSHWSEQNVGLSTTRITGVSIDPFPASGVLLASSFDRHSLFRREARSREWAPSDSGLPYGSEATIFDPLRPGVVYSTYLGVARSDDAGLHWAAGQPGYPTISLAIDPTTSRLYAGSFCCEGPGPLWGGIYWSDDGGNTLNVASLPYPLDAGTLTANSLAVDSDGTVYAGTGNGVLASRDGGRAFTRIGLEGQVVYALRCLRRRALRRNQHRDL
jgi:photosystem II stability/assembly factor-like uncharacterized protein